MPDRSNRNEAIWEEQSSPTSKARQPKEAVSQMCFPSKDGKCDETYKQIKTTTGGGGNPKKQKSKTTTKGALWLEISL